MLPTTRKGGWLPEIFDDFFDNSWMIRSNATAPAINVIESEKDYIVEIAAPGMNKGDFNIRINHDNQLVVSMEKKHEESWGDGSARKNDNKKEGTDKEWTQVDKAIEKHGGNSRYLRREFSYSRFQQAMILPDNIEKDKISANMEHGVMHIVIPKTTAHIEQAKERVIEIK